VAGGPSLQVTSTRIQDAICVVPTLRGGFFFRQEKEHRFAALRRMSLFGVRRFFAAFVSHFVFNLGGVALFLF
jgi:hypothetical protein